MKKILSLILVLVLCLGFTAVQATTDASTLDPTGVELNILICTQVQNDDLANTYLQKFADEHGIKLNIELAASTGYTDMLSLAMAEDVQGYDLVMVNSNHWGTLIDAGWIMPLDDFIHAEAEAGTDWYKGIMTAALDACVIDGQRWSVAYSAGVGILMYNKTMLEEAGIAEIPTTIDEVLATAAKVNDPANGKYGLSFRGGMERGIALPWLINWLYEGGTWYPENADNFAIFNTDAALKATQQLVDMYNYAPEGIHSYAWQEAMTAMQQGMAAMWVDAATLAVNLLDPGQTNLYEQFGFAALDGVSSWGDGWCFSIGSGTEHPEWCWELIKVATSYDTALDQIMRGTAISCYRSDVYANEEIYTVLPEDLCDAVEKSASMANIVYWPLISQSVEIATEMKNTLYAALTGQITPEAACEEMQATTIDILERDGVAYQK
ncbi:MAG: extracellular solute-binding protein [Candidatus Excrementavichristensenella sp.]|jgi:multiple sugar transport system substrate-binding protein